MIIICLLTELQYSSMKPARLAVSTPNHSRNQPSCEPAEMVSQLSSVKPLSSPLCSCWNIIYLFKCFFIATYHMILNFSDFCCLCLYFPLARLAPLRHGSNGKCPVHHCKRSGQCGPCPTHGKPRFTPETSHVLTN